MEDRFESAFRKIKRALKHIDDLEADVDTFWTSGPCQIDRIPPADSAEFVYRVTSIDKLPEVIPLIVGDAVHNIRSALDHFAFEAVPVSHRSENTTFPVWRKSATPSRAQWEKKARDCLKGASPRLLDAVFKLQPWEAGDDFYVWAVHELGRVDKHRLLISLAAANNLILLEGKGYGFETVKRFSGYAQDRSSSIGLEPAEWIPLEAGTVLFSSEGFADFGITDAQFSLIIALGEPDMLRGQVAVSQLRGLAVATERLLTSLAMPI